MTSYAAQKGRAAQSVRSTSPAAQISLTPADDARVATNKQFILEHMPELLPTIRNLHAEGLIDGWRAITHCRLTQETAS